MRKSSDVIEELGLSAIKKETAEKLLDAMYIVEDELGYENKSVSKIINYLQETYIQGDKPEVHFEGRGESGNIFFIMARVGEVITDPIEFNNLWKKVKQGTYTDALAAIREKVNLIDDDGVY